MEVVLLPTVVDNVLTSLDIAVMDPFMLVTDVCSPEIAVACPEMAVAFVDTFESVVLRLDCSEVID